MYLVFHFFIQQIWMFYVPFTYNWNKNLTPWMFTVQSKREAIGLKWDAAWSPEDNMDFRCADTLLIMPGTLARLGLCSAGAQLLLALFWASGIDGFKFVLWQLINTGPFLCGLPWSIFFYQAFHTAHNFPPDKINHSNVVLVSGIQQNEAAIYNIFYSFSNSFPI